MVSRSATEPVQLHTPYRADIDGLRAIAICAVLAFHAFPEAVPGGFVGVDVFFVISGFLISSLIFRSAPHGSFRFATFYANRVRRLLPALSLVLVASFVAGWYVLVPKELALLGREIVAGATFLENVTMWRSAGYFDTASELKPLMHLWSLGIEEQFYVVYPAAIVLVIRKKIDPLYLLVALFLVSFGLDVTRVNDHPIEAFFLLHTRFWELLSGGLLAYLHLFSDTRIARLFAKATARFHLAMSELGLLLVAYAIATAGGHKDFPGWWAVPPVLGTWLLIASANRNWIGKALLGNTVTVYVGLVSYPLYLWHWPLLSFSRIMDPHVTASTRLAILGASFVLAAATYHLVEKPVRFSRFRKVAVPVLACASVAAGLLGYEADAQGGFVSRLPATMAAVASYDYDYNAGARVGACWLTAGAGGTAFAKECTEEVVAKKHVHSFLIWGDSYAARLYPAAKTIFGDDHGIAQITRNTCPPILSWEDANCASGNRFAEGFLKEHPDVTVVMFANWRHYADDWSAETPLAKALLGTVRRLKADHVEKIIVLGPAPEWEGMLPAMVLRGWRSGGIAREVPRRMQAGLTPGLPLLDEEMRATLAGEHVVFESLLRRLCNAEGCLVRGDESATSFTTWDFGHFTTLGASIVLRDLPVD